jgi:hypothetical protein
VEFEVEFGNLKKAKVQSASRRQPLHGALMTHACAARPEKPSSQIDAERQQASASVSQSGVLRFYLFCIEIVILPFF